MHIPGPQSSSYVLIVGPLHLLHKFLDPSWLKAPELNLLRLRVSWGASVPGCGISWEGRSGTLVFVRVSAIKGCIVGIINSTSVL